MGRSHGIAVLGHLVMAAGIGACSHPVAGSGFDAAGGHPEDAAAAEASSGPDVPGAEDGPPGVVPVGSSDASPFVDAGLPSIDCGTTGVQDLVTADTAFAAALFSPAVAQADGGAVNAIVSPYSVSDALMMVDVGAAGRTASQIESVLHLPGSGAAEASAFGGLSCALQTDGSSNGNALYVADSMWGQQGLTFQQTFLDVLDQGYGAPLERVDFTSPATAASTIDTWVSQATQGNITSLLGPTDLSARTHLVLVNAVYFKGTWATGFDATMTAPAAFTLPDGSQTMVTTMSGTISARVSRMSSPLVLELPYMGGALAMDIVMPTAGSSLAAFVSTLTPATLGSALGSLSTPIWYVVSLPKFSIRTHIELAGVLAGMGVTDAFQEGVADLSGMDGQRDLSIGAVVHEARVEVDEQGTVAAAGTGVSVCSNCLAIIVPPSVQIDHPFLFLVRDTRNGAIVFLGQVVDPGQ